MSNVSKHLVYLIQDQVNFRVKTFEEEIQKDPSNLKFVSESVKSFISDVWEHLFSVVNKEMRE